MSKANQKQRKIKNMDDNLKQIRTAASDLDNALAAMEQNTAAFMPLVSESLHLTRDLVKHYLSMYTAGIAQLKEELALQIKTTEKVTTSKEESKEPSKEGDTSA